jgi:acyl-coenzyme A synthetase/AMP-(fatty) acid ligase
MSANELLSFLSERLPGHAMPDQVIFVKAIERTVFGKIRRHSATQVEPTEWALL